MHVAFADSEQSGRRRFLTALALLFMVLMAVSLMEAWPRLPDRLPLHFSFDGTPDGGGSKTEILIVVGVVILATLPMLAGGWWKKLMRRNPRWINMPRKAEILALSAEKQALYWELMVEFMAAMGAAMSLLFLLLIRGILAVVLNNLDHLPWWALWPGMGGLALVMLTYIPRMIRMPVKWIARGDGRPGGHRP